MRDGWTVLSALVSRDIWWDLDPRYWLENTSSPAGEDADFYKECPCLEWIVAVLAEQCGRFNAGRGVFTLLKTLLLDTWSRLDAVRELQPELGGRVLGLQHDFPVLEPGLTETWRLIGEEELDSEFELAQCISALARAIQMRADEDDFVEVVIGVYVGLRQIWSDALSPTIDSGWNVNHLRPEGREIDESDALVDQFLRVRYESLIKLLAAESRDPGL